MNEKKLFDKLSEKFETKMIAPFGVCTIIPVKDFEGEWKEKLLEENVKIFSNSYQNRICFFLRKSKQVHEESSKATKKPKPRVHKRSWPVEDTEKLKEYLAEGKSVKEISKLIGRSIQSIGAKMRHLPKNRKPVKSEPEVPSVVKEYLEAALDLLDSNKMRAAKILLSEASKFLEEI